MKKYDKEIMGWALFLVGFLVASATAMPKPPLWSVFVPALLLSVVGALVARANAGGAAPKTGAARELADLDMTRDAASLLQRMLDALKAISPDGDAEKIKAAIEDLQYTTIAVFVGERRQYLQKYGPVAFAHFFGAFAQGERNVNRAWSALVDGHRPEVATSLDRARASIGEALELVVAEGKH